MSHVKLTIFCGSLNFANFPGFAPSSLSPSQAHSASNEIFVIDTSLLISDPDFLRQRRADFDEPPADLVQPFGRSRPDRPPPFPDCSGRRGSRKVDGQRQARVAPGLASAKTR